MMCLNRLLLAVVCLTLFGCESYTSVRYRFDNATEDTVKMVFRARNTWADSTVLSIPPGRSDGVLSRQDHGKCDDCEHYVSPFTWMDSLVLTEGQWLRYPGPPDWSTQTHEGSRWLDFDHRLRVTPEMVGE